MKKKFLIFLLISITLYTIYIIISPQIKAKQKNNTIQQQDNSPFSIQKQVFYSGISPKSTSYNNQNWSLSISQYTDIAIYLYRNSEILDDSNTISSLYIDNIEYLSLPNIGTPNLYYQNPLKFATSSISSDYLIENHLNYNILNLENEDNFNYYSTPNFFTDCSIPITLKYVNSDILKDFKLPNNEPLIFDGSILKNSNLKLENLSAKLSFCINIVTNDNHLYKHTLELDIPLSNSEYNLLEQNIYLDKKTDLKFDSIEN